MANVKITELGALASAASADLVPVVDVTDNTTKKATAGKIVSVISGDVTVADDGTATISELPVSKLQDGAARQLLQTDAAGTGVEWTSNVDVPGTLDVTGAATFDSTASVAGDLAVNTNTLFVDASANAVGINTTNPNTTLEVNGSIRASQGSGGTIQLYEADATRRNSITLGSDANGSFIRTLYNTGGSYELLFKRGSTESARIDGSGRLLIGTSSDSGNTTLVLQGNSAGATATPTIAFKRNIGVAANNEIAVISFSNVIGGEGANLKAVGDGTWSNGTSHPTRLVFSSTPSGSASPTPRMTIDSTGRTIFTKSGDPVVIGGVSNAASIYRDGTNMGGIHFSTFSVLPANSSGNASDDSFDLGAASSRWNDVYATNGTIQTSDQSLKQDVAQLTDAEIAAAKVIRGLVKTYRWIDSVEEKGDEARIHVGVIAQEVEQAFIDQGLDPTRYALFCKDTWYAVDGKAMDDSGETYTEDAPGAVLVERRGVRYPQLLAFVMAAVDAEATTFEARLAALEAN